MDSFWRLLLLIESLHCKSTVLLGGAGVCYASVVLQWLQWSTHLSGDRGINLAAGKAWFAWPRTNFN